MKCGQISIHSIRKRTREDLGKEREVAHTDVRRRERNMHGRIFVPWIEGGKKRVDVRTVGFAVSFRSKASPTTGTLPV